jgi:hypothetical protein
MKSQLKNWDNKAQARVLVNNILCAWRVTPPDSYSYVLLSLAGPDLYALSNNKMVIICMQLTFDK